MKTILIISNQEKMQTLFTFHLSPRFICINKNSSEDALSYLKSNQAHLVLISVSQPESDECLICEKIRESSLVPVIVVSESGDSLDVIRALKCGADDCLSQPFHADELLARIEAVLRRSEISDKNILQMNGLIWDKESFELRYKDQYILLAPKEFSILGLFLSYPNKVFSQKELAAAIWGKNAGITSSTIHSYIRNIRDKLRQAGFPVDLYLLTVWGVGYRWDELNNKHRKQ